MKLWVMKLQKESHFTVGSMPINKYKGTTEIVCGAFQFNFEETGLAGLTFVGSE
jgi:hypothetical protein